jgi:mannosyltransferase OCH1-like enzyme
MSFTIQDILPTNNKPIKNKVELINSTNDDFHYVLYYLEYNKFKIIIRRIDYEGGWGVNLKLKIFSIDGRKEETISLGSSYNNCKIMNIYTSIKVEPINFDDSNQLIPKLIFQTTHKKNIDNVLHYNSIMSYIELNPEYEYRVLNDDDSRDFIKQNFEKDVLKAYDMLISGAFKADLFRYCFLYINGGCYFDCKSILRKPLRYIISPNDDLILCKDIGLGYYNAVMMSIPKNNVILKCIHESVDNILNFNLKYNINHPEFNNVDTILSLTGPVLLYNVVSNLGINKINNIIKLYHRHSNNHYHNYMRLYVEYKGEYIITKQYHNYVSNGTHYSDLWINKKVVYS